MTNLCSEASPQLRFLVGDYTTLDDRAVRLRSDPPAGARRVRRSRRRHAERPRCHAVPERDRGRRADGSPRSAPSSRSRSPWSATWTCSSVRVEPRDDTSPRTPSSRGVWRPRSCRGASSDPWSKSCRRERSLARSSRPSASSTDASADGSHDRCTAPVGATWLPLAWSAEVPAPLAERHDDDRTEGASPYGRRAR